MLNFKTRLPIILKSNGRILLLTHYSTKSNFILKPTIVALMIEAFIQL